FLVGGAVIVVPRDVLPVSRQRCQEHEESGQDHPAWDTVIVAHARAPPNLSVPYVLLLSDDSPGELRESRRTVRARRPLTVLSPRSTVAREVFLSLAQLSQSEDRRPLFGNR